MTAGPTWIVRYLRRAVIGVLATSALGCAPADDQSGATATLRRGISGEPATLDPAQSADTYSDAVLRDVYEGLTSESPTGDVIPGIASSWTVDSSGTLYTFKLRENALWSNGKPVTAQDFVVAWQRVVDPKQGSPVADLLRVVAGASTIMNGKAPVTTLGVTAVSATELQVRLVEPAPYFPGLMSHPAAFPIYSDSAARTHNPAFWVSDGAYVLARWRPGTDVTLERNSAYWDRKHVAIAHVNYLVASDDTAQMRSYRAGELDLTDTVPANAVPRLREEHSTEFLSAPFLGTVYYGLNLTTAPLASNPKLRQALAMAVDRKRLVQTLGFGQAGAYGFIPPNTWNYTPQTFDWRGSDDPTRIAEAQKLYAEAGYSIRSPLRLRLLYNTNPAIRQTAIVTAAMWKEVLGVETKLMDEEYRVFLESRHDKSRWEIARLAWSADYNDAGNFLETLRSTSINNDEGYRNPAYDALLDEAARTADASARRGQLEAAERLMLADAPIVPLYYFVSKRMAKPYLVGARINPLNHLPSKLLSFATRR